ncbi:MAG: hypothetical protein WCP10_09005 [Desulfuromonadales bacterium]
MKKCVSMICTAGVLAGMLAIFGCGGGGDSGNDNAPATTASTTTFPSTVSVGVSKAGSITDGGPSVSTTYTMSAGDYTYFIAGFGSGDKLIFPTGQAATINNSNYSDGIVDVQWASGNQTITIRLTGLTNAQDLAIMGPASFKALFGSASLQ